MSDKIIWLAAYPKTGSTWVRTIIQQLLAPEVLGKEAIPSFSRDYPEDAPAYDVMGTRAKVLRTHCHPNHKVFRRLIEDRSDEIVGILTIQRHPLDVLLSQLNYAYIKSRDKSFKDGVVKKAEEIISDGEIGYYINAFIEADGCPEYIKRCQSYPKFYSDWRKLAPQARHLHLQYESLVKDPLGGINKLGSFLGLPDMDAAGVMNSVEERTKLNGKFFWRKKAYNHRDLLPPDSISRFEMIYSDRLRELGYVI